MEAGLAVMKLLTIHNYKLEKSADYGWTTAGLALSPANEAAIVLQDSSLPSMCPFAGECTSVCLSKTGMNQWPKSAIARAKRTQLYVRQPEQFYSQLIGEIQRAMEKANGAGMAFAFRPNLLSDQPKIAQTILTHVPFLQCYDYTKIPQPWKRKKPNYHLTMSYSEKMTPRSARECLENGVNVAMVFPIKKDKPFPDSIVLDGKQYPIIDGDKHDLRFLDPPEVVVGLRFKGSSKRLPLATQFVQKEI